MVRTFGRVLGPLALGLLLSQCGESGEDGGSSGDDRGQTGGGAGVSGNAGSSSGGVAGSSNGGSGGSENGGNSGSGGSDPRGGAGGEGGAGDAGGVGGEAGDDSGGSGGSSAGGAGNGGSAGTPGGGGNGGGAGNGGSAGAIGGASGAGGAGVGGTGVGGTGVGGTGVGGAGVGGTGAGGGGGTGGGVGGSGGAGGAGATGGGGGSGGSGGKQCPQGSTGENCERCLVYVNQSGGSDQNTGNTWAAAKATLQSGIEAAFANAGRCDVWVAQGTYRPTFKADPFGPANTSTLQMRAGIKLYGGFAGNELALGERNVATRATILDGAPDSVIRTVTAAEGARLDGFTVDGGGVAGSLLVSSGTFELAWCTFRRIRYQSFTSVSSGATLTVTDSLFVDSGRPLSNSGTLVIRRSEFRNNRFGGSGAAIFVNSSATLEVTDSTFVGNGSSANVGGGGGAIDTSTGSIVLIERSTFRDNEVLGDPAAMTTNGLAYGGAIDASSSSSQITIRDSIFQHNVVRGRTTGGGAIRGNAMTIVNTHFIDNHSEGTTDADGGAIEAEGALDMVGGSFRENSSGYRGGAVLCSNRCRFAGVSFAANATPQSGGAVYRSGTQGLSVASSSFSSNTAGVNGGAIYNSTSGGSAEIASSTFFGNMAAAFGGGLYNTINGSANITNSIFWANGAGTQGPQIYNNTGVTMTLASSDVQGSGFSGASGNIDADPQFLNVTPSALDLRLNAASPCVNTGNTTLLPLDVLDMDADANVSEALPLDVARNARVSGPAVDMGCYER